MTSRDFGVRVEGLDELRRELRKVDSRLSKALQSANKQIATDVAYDAQSNVAAEPTPASARAAQGIRARAKQNQATIALLGSNPVTLAATLGTITHPVFGRTMLQASFRRPVWRPWIGRSWTAENGPYGVSEAIRDAIPKVMDRYGDAVLDALAAAFPDA